MLNFCLSIKEYNYNHPFTFKCRWSPHAYLISSLRMIVNKGFIRLSRIGFQYLI